MSYTAPYVTISIASRDQILEGADILQRLLDATPKALTNSSYDENAAPLAPFPADDETAEEAPTLTPQQKAAITRKKNKEKKEQEALTRKIAEDAAAIATDAGAGDSVAATIAAQAVAGMPASPLLPATAAAPTPQQDPAAIAAAVAPQAAIVPAPAAAGVIDYQTMSAEAGAKHQALALVGQGSRMVDLLAQYGVQRLDELDPGHYVGFVQAVRSL